MSLRNNFLLWEQSVKSLEDKWDFSFDFSLLLHGLINKDFKLLVYDM